MTLKRILLYIAAAGLLATACSEKEQQPEEETKPLVEPVMTLLSGEIPIFTDQGGETTVSFSSTCPWKVTSSAKWVVITPSSGEAGEELEVTVKVLASNVYEQRHSTLTFSCSNGKEDDSKTLEVLQKQEGALIVSPSSIIVKAAGGTVSINVKASYEVSFEILGESAKEWIIPVEESKVYVNNDIEFEIKPNELFEERRGTISFSNEIGSEDVTIIQAAALRPDAHIIKIYLAEDLVDFAQRFNNKSFIELEHPLEVSLESDITFDETSSAALNVIGGIGIPDENYFFSGTFDGKDFSINGLSATSPLFVSLAAEGTVKNLTIGETSSFTFTHSDAADALLGAVAGSVNGTIDNVSVAAVITIAEGAVSHATSLGGIAGQLVSGLIKDSNFSGAITVPYGFTVNSNKTFVGGLAGEISDAAGKIESSDFEGVIDFAGSVVSDDESNPYLLIGGIVGSNDGTVSACNTKDTNPKAITMDNGASYTAAIQNHSRKAFHLAQGGISGANKATISDCTNSASIKNFVLSNGTQGGTAADANSLYYNLGGIVGLNLAEGTVSGCVNDVTLESRANPAIQRIGGVVAYNLGTVSSSSNSGSLYITKTDIAPNSLHSGEIGGVIGNNAGASVSDVHNDADIHIDATESSAGAELRVGGVVGITTAAIDGGDLKKIANNGDILDDFNGPTITSNGICIGGVVGSARASVKNVTNSGSVTYQTSSATPVSKIHLAGIAGEVRDASEAQISGCENSGEVNLNLTKDALHADDYVGGIAGKTFNSSVSISNCTNSGSLKSGNATRHNGTSMYMGGIIAYLDGESSVLDCSNTGTLYNNHNNNNDTIGSTALTGGIAGYAEGEDGTPVVIGGTTGCSVDASVGANRGWIAGIVAYAKYVDISNCTVEQDINCSPRGGGGLVGKAEYCNISSSAFKGDKIQINNTQVTTGQGGIVGGMDNTTVDGCYCYATTITNNVKIPDVGAIAGVSGANNVIKNCHYRAKITVSPTTGGTAEVDAKIAGSGTFTDDGSNAADITDE